MTLLPCHNETGCDAPCCIALATWDSWSFNRLMRYDPETLEKYQAKSVMIAGARNHFVILPDKYPFEFLNGTIGAREFIKLAEGKLENYSITGANEIRCVFLKSSKCSVYDYRPSVCQKFGVVPEMPCPKAQRGA
jgi:Fe-S-cluster containining protein